MRKQCLYFSLHPGAAAPSPRHACSELSWSLAFSWCPVISSHVILMSVQGVLKSCLIQPWMPAFPGAAPHPGIPFSIEKSPLALHLPSPPEALSSVPLLSHFSVRVGPFSSSSSAARGVFLHPGTPFHKGSSCSTFFPRCRLPFSFCCLEQSRIQTSYIGRVAGVFGEKKKHNTTQKKKLNSKLTEMKKQAVPG